MAELSNLPGPVADLWTWQLDAACRETDNSLFFHPEGERGPRRRARDAAAKAICASCPSLMACREHALAVREPYGVWGGLTEEERSAILAERDKEGAAADSPNPAPVVVVLPDPAVGPPDGNDLCDGARPAAS
ncbi:MAG: transcription factor WhiB [Micrococcales bacterium]|nr:MAG: transcription factor WhiB [Micrococcales bacterium]PIE27871.1 MAG: transcription factor WhiB [Micrococcales bacterium]